MFNLFLTRQRIGFANLMDKLHGCHVEQETDNQMFLASINKQYFFWIDKVNDPNWKVIK